MTRRSLFFDCEGSGCAATLDLPPDGMATRTTGLLIVTGGNELRSGPHASQAAMAAHFAGLGFPVFRYDRRGVSDSAGANSGWRAAEADVVAAAAAFRAKCPSLTHVIGYGNCDGASSVALYGRAAGLSRVVLANPWVFDHDGESPASGQAPPTQPQHSRVSTLHYYRRRLADPIGLARDLLGGRVNVGQAMGDLAKASQAAEATTTAAAIAAALNGWGDNATLLLARDDRTALYFKEQMATMNHKCAPHICPTASHSFAEPEARAWLFAQIEAALSGP